jgi:CMP-N,N'-diacetyllegionaminic acid synthase
VIVSNKTILCIILARGGSKGVPGKNIKDLNGKPLIYYTIKSIQEAGIYDRVILSTDSISIAEVALKYGVEVPFMRPSYLSTDSANALDAVQHALKWVESNDKVYDYVQYIFPTAPLRTSVDLLNGVNTLLNKDADMVISVCKTDHPAQWMNTLSNDNSLKNFIKLEFRQINNQALPATYRINGSIYVARWEIFFNKLDWFKQETVAYIMSRKNSIDIDTEFDFLMAEFLIKKAHPNS